MPHRRHHENALEIIQPFVRDIGTSSDVQIMDGVEVKTYTRRELSEHSALMITECSSRYRHHVLGIAALKATLLFAFENNPRIVTAWRHVAERHAGLIVKNA